MEVFNDFIYCTSLTIIILVIILSLLCYKLISIVKAKSLDKTDSYCKDEEESYTDPIAQRIQAISFDEDLLHEEKAILINKALCQKDVTDEYDKIDRLEIILDKLNAMEKFGGGEEKIDLIKTIFGIEKEN